MVRHRRRPELQTASWRRCDWVTGAVTYGSTPRPFAGARTYRPRVVDRELAELLGSVGATVIEGPKACGKTETARQVARSEVRLDVDANARQAAAVGPSLLLEGAVPRLLDEWQLAPALWNYVRRTIDDRRRPGQFVLTGSAVPVDDVTRHTGAGRVARLRMRPMSLFESGHATGEVSLSEVLEGVRPRAGAPEMTVADLAVRIAVGGWPGLLEHPVPQALRAVRAYVDEIRRTDIQRVEGVAHDPEKVLLLMRSLARHVSTMVSLATLARDVAEPDDVQRIVASNGLCGSLYQESDSGAPAHRTQPKRIGGVDRIPIRVPIEVEPTRDADGILLGYKPH